MEKSEIFALLHELKSMRICMDRIENKITDSLEWQEIADLGYTVKAIVKLRNDTKRRISLSGAKSIVDAYVEEV